MKSGYRSTLLRLKPGNWSSGVNPIKITYDEMISNPIMYVNFVLSDGEVSRIPYFYKNNIADDLNVSFDYYDENNILKSDSMIVSPGTQGAEFNNFAYKIVKLRFNSIPANGFQIRTIGAQAFLDPVGNVFSLFVQHGSPSDFTWSITGSAFQPGNWSEKDEGLREIQMIYNPFDAALIGQAVSTTTYKAYTLPLGRLKVSINDDAFLSMITVYFATKQFF